MEAHLVEEDDAAARGGRARGLPVALVAPVVEDGHVARPAGPAALHEELREAVELEVDVEPDDGQQGGVELVEDEGGLGRDGLEAEALGALGRLGPEGGGGQLGGLAADAHTRARAEEALGLGWGLGVRVLGC